MNLQRMQIASWLGLDIHGFAANGNFSTRGQGGAGLIIIAKVIVFNGIINLRGSDELPLANSGGAYVPAGGAGSLIFSTDNLLQNSGIVDVSSPVVYPVCCIPSYGGNGYFYLIEY